MSDTYETEERMVLEQSQMEYQHVDLNAVLAFTNLGTAVQYSSEIDDVTLSMEKHLVGNDDAFQVKPMSIDLLDVLHTIY